MAIKNMWKLMGFVAAASLLAGCATPGHVVVKTMSMQRAYHEAQGGGSNVVKQLAKSAAFQHPLYTPPPGIGIVEAPKIAMAYVYPWVDANDTLHMGTWVGIPISGFQWKTSGGIQAIPNVNQSQTSISGEK
ncbi:hypothetical protein B1757_13220 [Acidithiobacillus marinus]|uniref:Conjugal transfer protein n=1 Tax=Acidithiobacillus marinus TaxID=187490 RepID=A0A2I1DIR7_9PROT|nr:hypothetical protein [Acidithiobacillus marinus]PKY09755.1 hypothetical protein B1757_13220 [Acidithiobacillus marinus]